MKFALIDAERANFEIRMMCRLLDVSTSGFYEWRYRPLSDRALRREALKIRIDEEFVKSDRTYGYRRVQAELGRADIKIAE